MKHLVLAMAATAFLGSAEAAAAPATCWFRSTDATLFVDLHGGPAKLRASSTGKILLDGVQCEEATVTSTDTIRIAGSVPDDDTLTLVNPAAFAPGLTPEATGSSEIEIEIGDGLSGGNDLLLLPLTNDPDLLTFSTSGNDGGIDLLNDGDQDLSFMYDSVNVIVMAKSGADVIDVSGLCLCASVSVFGGYGNDTIIGAGYAYGEAGKDELYARANGAGYLNGGPGADLMVGGDNDDTFDQGSARNGADIMIGGGGLDEVDYRLRVNTVVVTTGDGAANDGEAGEGDNVGSDVERVFGGQGDDVLVGSDVANRLYGREGNDDLYGGGGNDYLSGGDGDDFLKGEAGGDTLYGDEGNDLLEGGTGRDFLHGGSGNDELHGDAGSDYFWGDDGDDHIFSVDGIAETVHCGSGSDTPEFEAVDSYDADCELP